MTIEALSIIIYALLIFSVVAVQAGYTGVSAGPAYSFSNRDERTAPQYRAFWVPDQPHAVQPIERCDHVPSIRDSGGCLGYLERLDLSRVFYIPQYLLGNSTLRTIVWAPSFIAIPVMAFWY